MFDSSLDLDLTGLSARNRAIFARGVRGGADDDGVVETPDTATLLAAAGDVTDLSDDDLVTLHDNLAAAATELVADPDSVTAEALAEAQTIAAAVGTLRTTYLERAEAADVRAEEARGVLAALAPVDAEHIDDAALTDAEVDAAAAIIEPPAAATTEVVEPAEPVVVDGEIVEPLAAAATIPVATRVVARRPAATRPLPKPSTERETLKLVASANAPGVPAGMELDTNEKIAKVFDHALRASKGTHSGARFEMPLMSVGVSDPVEQFGAARTLGRDAQTNEQKIMAVTSREALRGTGGICAPAPQRYDLPTIGTNVRPVKAVFAGFGVPHGGIRLLPPPILSDVAAGIGVWTNANDIDPGSDGPEVKPCVVLDCPDEVETLVAAITQCMTVGNFRNRFFPEQIRAWLDLLSVQSAKIAETRLIQKLGDLSTQVSVSQVLGTTRTILAALDRAGATLRNAHRLDPDAPLRFLGPEWLKDNMITDLSREAPGARAERLATSDANIQSWFASRQINAGWFLDGEAGQTFGVQGNGLLLPWPSHVVCYLYIEGSWLHLDGGEENFGIVRDSVLNGTNDFQMFSEFFEESAFHGTPGTSYRLDIDICPSGEAASLSNTSDLCVGS